MTSTATEGQVLPASSSLTFNTTNWNVPQTVTVVGVPDGILDGNQPYQVLAGPATSLDRAYNGATGYENATNLDIQTGFLRSAAPRG